MKFRPRETCRSAKTSLIRSPQRNFTPILGQMDTFSWNLNYLKKLCNFWYKMITIYCFNYTLITEKARGTYLLCSNRTLIAIIKEKTIIFCSFLTPPRDNKTFFFQSISKILQSPLFLTTSLWHQVRSVCVLEIVPKMGAVRKDFWTPSVTALIHSLTLIVHRMQLKFIWGKPLI